VTFKFEKLEVWQLAVDYLDLIRSPVNCHGAKSTISSLR